MSIIIDDVPSNQVLDVHEGDVSYLSLFVSWITAEQAAALTASLGGANSFFFVDRPSVYSVNSTSVEGQYLVILALTGTVSDNLGGLSEGDVFDIKRPFDPELTVTVTSGDQSSDPAEVVAIYINPPN